MYIINEIKDKEIKQIYQKHNVNSIPERALDIVLVEIISRENIK